MPYPGESATFVPGFVMPPMPERLSAQMGVVLAGGRPATVVLLFDLETGTLQYTHVFLTYEPGANAFARFCGIAAGRAHPGGYAVSRALTGHAFHYIRHEPVKGNPRDIAALAHAQPPRPDSLGDAGLRLSEATTATLFPHPSDSVPNERGTE
jgi:hypothetical protein